MDHTDGKRKAERIALMLEGLCIYRNLFWDPVIQTFLSLCKAVAKSPEIPVSHFMEYYSELFYKLSLNNCGVNISEYVFDRILLDENPFTVSSAFPEITPDPAILAAAVSDLHALKYAVSIPSSLLKEAVLQDYPEAVDCRNIISALPDWAGLTGGNALQWKNEDTSIPADKVPKISATGAADKRAGAGGSSSIGIGELKRLWSSDATVEKLVHKLMEYHAANGYGIFSRKYAFTWHRGSAGRLLSTGNSTGNIPGNHAGGFLTPVHNPDPVRLSDLIAYESEREEVIRNTEQFLEGHPSNNVLLYGDRGTGKSSTVKALLNEYAGRGLRMVEVPKRMLADFPEIVGILADKPYKFILFVDDLSFEDSEDSYTALKAVIEGGLEIRPQNVLIYATTNRRHLVRENFSDRLGLQYGSKDDEIRSVDTMQEKLSLSDRFGITVVFASPDKKRFLEIVDGLAKKNGVDMDPETLHREALKWELWYNGRSPRTAQQFINYIGCRNGK